MLSSLLIPYASQLYFISNRIRIDNTVHGYLYSVRNADRAARGSDRRNNIVSWISEIKDTSNVSVRKKRGRRPHPSAKRLCDKKVDKEIDSDDAVDNCINDTDGQVGKNQSVVCSDECVDGRTGDGLQKTGQPSNSSNGTFSASEEQDHSTNSKDILQKGSSQTTKKVSGSSMRNRQNASHLEQEGADEDGSHVQVADVNKSLDDERCSHEITDDVSSLVLQIYLSQHLYFIYDYSLIAEKLSFEVIYFLYI